MKKPEIGDVVYLNSGSPAMTVKSVDKDAIVGCYWEGDKETEYHEFPSACLTKTVTPVGE